VHFSVHSIGNRHRTQVTVFPDSIIVIAPTPPSHRAEAGWIEPANIEHPLSIDCRYFIDLDGYHRRILHAGIRVARGSVEAEPMRTWVVRGVVSRGGFSKRPGRLASLGRRASRPTTFVGTARSVPTSIAFRHQPRAAGPRRGGLQITDASASPHEPVGTAMFVAESAADLMLADAHRPTWLRIRSCPCALHFDPLSPRQRSWGYGPEPPRTNRRRAREASVIHSFLNVLSECVMSNGRMLPSLVART
jgi:hypothetical protein